MKTKELIEILQTLDAESEVILQKDSEGNQYSPLEGVEGNAIYVPEASWNGEVYSFHSTADDNCLDDKWEKLKNGPKCVVLYPVN